MKCMMFVWFLLETGTLDQNQGLRESFFCLKSALTQTSSFYVLTRNNMLRVSRILLVIKTLGNISGSVSYFCLVNCCREIELFNGINLCLLPKCIRLARISNLLQTVLFYICIHFLFTFFVGSMAPIKNMYAE